MSRNNDDLCMRVKASLFPLTTMGCCMDINNPYYIISRARPDNDKEFVRVFESEFLKDTSNPVFGKRRHKLALICNADTNLAVKISFYSNIPKGTDKIYGEAITTIGVLVSKMNA